MYTYSILGRLQAIIREQNIRDKLRYVYNNSYIHNIPTYII
jgi:hypothetical protein